jgi:CO/xanthine dehydrogenase Mo-binding subunit
VPTNPQEVPLQSRDGSPFFIAPHSALAIDAARYVGEPISVVVAEMLAQAMDAAERLDVSYEVLPAVARSRDALPIGHVFDFTPSTSSANSALTSPDRGGQIIRIQAKRCCGCRIELPRRL